MSKPLSGWTCHKSKMWQYVSSVSPCRTSHNLHIFVSMTICAGYVQHYIGASCVTLSTKTNCLLCVNSAQRLKNFAALYNHYDIEINVPSSYRLCNLKSEIRQNTELSNDIKFAINCRVPVNSG